MERIREMGKYQRGVLFLTLAMIVIFTILYPLLYPRVGFMCNNDYAYSTTFLEMRQEGEVTVYEGWVEGKKLTFRIEEADTLVCYYADKTYGPFTVRRDPTAKPNTLTNKPNLVGVEILEGEEVFFRGGVLVTDRENMYMKLYDEEFYSYNPGEIILGNSSTVNVKTDPIKPKEATILRLLAGPKLSRAVNWWDWVSGMYFAICTVIYALFADELFRFRMSFRVSNAENLYPSDWEIASRYIGWTACAAIALYFFVKGLIP